MTAGWRIQVFPQYCREGLSSSEFFSVPIPYEDEAIAAVRNREGASPGERVYAVRPLRREELSDLVVRP